MRNNLGRSSVGLFIESQSLPQRPLIQQVPKAAGERLGRLGRRGFGHGVGLLNRLDDAAVAHDLGAAAAGDFSPTSTVAREPVVAMVGTGIRASRLVSTTVVEQPATSAAKAAAEVAWISFMTVSFLCWRARKRRIAVLISKVKMTSGGRKNTA